LLKKSEIINNGCYVNKWDREKSEGCEIKGKANYKKNVEKEKWEWSLLIGLMKKIIDLIEKGNE
jgi:hypothetical protein